MSITCKLGLHQWSSCKCSVCGKERDTGHQWNGCECTVCGWKRDEQHEWVTVYRSCSGCPNEPLSVEDLTGSLCYEADGCEAQRCKICGKQTEWNISAK